jgi:hypothetical protein
VLTRIHGWLSYVSNPCRYRRPECRVALVILAIMLMPAVAAAQAAGGAPLPFERGSTVQLQGCVVKGEQAGSFVFSRVTAWPLIPSPDGVFGPRSFWLVQAVDQLREHIGRTIQVTGIVEEVLESEVERNPGYNSKNGQRVAIELPSGDVFTSPELAGVGPGGRDSRVDMKITLIKVRVESLLVVMASCLPSMR